MLYSGQEGSMLFTIAVILLVLWLLGMVSGYTLGNFIYVLLVIALVLFVVGLVSGRRAGVPPPGRAGRASGARRHGWSGGQAVGRWSIGWPSDNGTQN